MAQVRINVSERIDTLLEYLIEEWSALPQAERDIDAWDSSEQVDYIEEWTPKLDLLDELGGYAADGLLNDEQQARLAELRGLVEKYQPILTRLRNS